MSVDQPAGSPDESSGPDAAPLLDFDCDNPTRWEKRLSGADSADDDSGGDDDGDDWSRQQKRVYHRVNTLLHYWESHDYQIVWVTLTSSPGSDDADRLAYNLQRLRQTIERAALAYDGDGEAHRLSHLTELEQLCIRTSEGPEGKGVLHLFWAWDPPSGHHSRDLYIPQHWLARQWGRIHGPHGLHSPGDLEMYDDAGIEPLYVWIEEYGSDAHHSRENVASYCVTQYLGEHGEALEHLSWSHGRSLGGSLLSAWRAIRDHRERLAEAVEDWETVIAGDPVTLGGQSEHIHYGLQVRPPPDLGVEEVEEVSITPPDEYHQQGPAVGTVRRVAQPMPEFGGWPTDRECPECGSPAGIHRLPDGHTRRESDDTDRTRYLCVACKQPYAERGDGTYVNEERMELWGVEPAGPGDADDDEQADRDVSGVTAEVDGSTLDQLSRRGDVYPTADGDGQAVGVGHVEVRERVERAVEEGAETVPAVMGRLELAPDQREVVVEVLES